MEDKLQTYINEEILADQDGVEVDVDDELLAEGLIDSLGVMRLIAFIDMAFAITVPPQDVTIENFRSIAVIARYLAGKSPAASGT